MSGNVERNVVSFIYVVRNAVSFIIVSGNVERNVVSLIYVVRNAVSFIIVSGILGF